MDEREMQWANPSIPFPLPETLIRALAYLRILLSNRDRTQWLSLCKKLTEPHGPDYSIAPRWRNLMGLDWGSLPDRPSPLAVDNATKPLSIESSLSKRAAALRLLTTLIAPAYSCTFPRRKKQRPLADIPARHECGLLPSKPSGVAMPPGTKRPYIKYWLAASRNASDITVARPGLKNS